MSAFVVPRSHVAAIVKWARSAHVLGWNAFTSYGPSDTALSSTRAADILMRENVRSVSYRYPEDTARGDLPGSIGELADATFTHAEILAARVLTPSEVLHAVACLDYQSCETPDWQETTAHALLRRIELAAELEGGSKRGSAHDCRCWPIYPAAEDAARAG
jgi:hypothetical protein